MATKRPNTYPGNCRHCGARIGAQEGLLGPKVDGKWTVLHNGPCPSEAPGATTQPASTHMSYPPTDEQAAILKLVATGENVVVQAGAGAGKTSTLKFIAQWMLANGLTGAYRAFNSRIVKDTAKSMPGIISVRTMHADALASLPHYRDRLPGGAKVINRQHGGEQARILGIDSIQITVDGESRTMAAGWIASRVMAAVRTFCRSADEVITRDHIEYIDGIDMPTQDGARTFANNDRLAKYMLPFVQAAWADLTARDGKLRFSHDVYLKVWSLGDPVIDGDILMVDEAQDTDPVQMVVIRKQADRGMQVIVVGDEQQTIYDWRGAVDALGVFEAQGAKVAFLTQSFRFGDAVADVANGLLARLDARLRLRGFGPVASTVGPIDEPDAILCRTNAGAIRTLLAQIAADRKAALFGSVADIVSFMRGAIRLQAGESTTNPELATFASWGAVLAYVESEPEGQDLKLMVKLVEDFGAEVILEAVEHQPDPDKADVVISTAHKTKGLEWARVQIGADFLPPKTKGADLSQSELRLAYVACTRAKLELDLSLVPHFTPEWSPGS